MALILLFHLILLNFYFYLHRRFCLFYIFSSRFCEYKNFSISAYAWLLLKI
nr:MAG TPA: hypothetical protein [Caudoviricetes sp.]